MQVEGRMFCQAVDTMQVVAVGQGLNLGHVPTGIQLAHTGIVKIPQVGLNDLAATTFSHYCNCLGFIA